MILPPPPLLLLRFYYYYIIMNELVVLLPQAPTPTHPSQARQRVHRRACTGKPRASEPQG